MKTPDQIKKALECCFNAAQCADCPYYPISCDRELVRDAQEYIRPISCDRELVRDAQEYIRQLETERDAYREGMKVELGCYACKHYVDDPDYDSNECMACGKNRRNFEWRGVQKEE